MREGKGLTFLFLFYFFVLPHLFFINGQKGGSARPTSVPYGISTHQGGSCRSRGVGWLSREARPASDFHEQRGGQFSLIFFMTMSVAIDALLGFFFTPFWPSDGWMKLSGSSKGISIYQSVHPMAPVASLKL